MPKLIEGCGCCGRIIKNAEWCADCRKHILRHGNFEDRTYFAQHDTPCPYQVGEFF